MIKLTNEYMKLNEKELMLVGGKAGIGKTRFIVNEVNNSQRDNKVLFLSLEASKDKLMYDYKLQVSNNLTVIDTKTNIDDLKNYLEKEYDYIYIDHLGLFSDDVISTLKKLVDYINEYNVKVFMTDYIAINEKDDKYNDEKYNLLTSIYVLKEETINKLKLKINQ